MRLGSEMGVLGHDARGFHELLPLGDRTLGHQPHGQAGREGSRRVRQHAGEVEEELTRPGIGAERDLRRGARAEAHHPKLAQAPAEGPLLSRRRPVR